MSLTLIITGAVCLFLLIIILVSANKNKKQKQINFLKPLNNLAQSVDCKVTRNDIWNNSVIGIDEARNYVFVIQKNITGDAKLAINLSEVFRCRVTEKSRVSGPKEGNIKAFDRIDLVFTLKDKSKPEILVEFYNSDTDRLTLAGELQLAEKWCAIINNRSAQLNK